MTRDDITRAMDAPPPEDLTRPEVRLPVDMPPDDLTEMHIAYSVGDESTASLPNEAPFGAHQEPEPTTLPIERWLPPSNAPPSSVSAPTRPRARTLAVEEEVNTGWSLPLPTTPPSGSPTPPRAPSSTPPSIVVSASIEPPAPQPWSPSPPQGWNPAPAPAWTPPTPAPVAYPQPYGAPQGPSYPPAQGYAPPATQSVRPGGYGTVEMNLAMMHGVPTPMPPGPGGPTQIAPRAAPPKGGVSRAVWVLVVLALLACGAMMVWARVRGAG